MREAGELPVYYPDDAEVYLRAADMPDGSLLCTFTNISLDILDEIPLSVDRPVNDIQYITPDGKWERASFSECDGKVVIDMQALTLHPVVFKIS